MMQSTSNPRDGRILKKSSQFVFLKEYTTETILYNVDQGIGIPLKWTEKK